MEIRRGYVKWTDENGVFHKEPLHEHPELLAKATPAQQIAAEEARRLNEHAKEYQAAAAEQRESDEEETLEALQSAPADALTTADLVAVPDGDGGELIVPVSESVTSANLVTESRVLAQGTDEVEADEKFSWEAPKK